MKLTAISIRDLGCISYRVIEIGPDGNEIKGPCGTGKSTIGDAIEMTLTGLGISKDAIRKGADRAELMAHFDDPPNPSFTARQVIPREGSPKLTIRNNEGDTRPWQSPREKMLEKFGKLFDPVEFLKATKSRRIEMLSEVIEMPVTAEDLERWTGEVCEVPAGKFGLEVIDDVRAGFETRRTEANKVAAKAKTDHAAAVTKAKSLDRPEHKGVEVPLEGEEDLPLREAEKARDALVQRKADAEAMAVRTQGTRSRIAELRAERDDILARPDAVRDAQTIACVHAELEEAQEDFERARLRVETKRNELDKLEIADVEAKRLLDQAESCHTQADDLEATLASATIVPPTEAEMAAAGDAVTAAMSKVELIRAAREAHDALYEEIRLGQVEADATTKAKALQAIVDRLTTDAPAEMVERSKAIPGLAIVDGNIFLDGVSFDRCGGHEKIDFAVDLAKRANPLGKLIKVDEVGSMDDQTRARFYEKVIEGGWSLIAIRPWCDPEKEVTEPIIVPIKEAAAEARGKKRVKGIMPDGAA
jgi:hypothetical protein